MKGLILTQTGKKDEGLELAKKGARFDLTSHIVWHVLGLIHKADKNYDEAHRSYMQALKFEKDSINILRDAAALEIQLRLFDALQETRWAILRLRPNVRGNWIGLALACHLGGNHAEARKVLEVYETTVKVGIDRVSCARFTRRRISRRMISSIPKYCYFTFEL